jgi:prohibitin 1
MAQRLLNRIIFGSLGLGLGALTLGSSMYTVEPGERAVLFDRFRNGVLDNVYEEGLHFRIPWVQWPIFYDVRTKPKPIKRECRTKDLQTVKILIRVLYRPEISKLPQTYRDLGIDYDEKLLPSFGYEILGSETAQYDAGELITQREAVSRKIREALVNRSSQYGIILDDVSIIQVTFSKEFTEAIEKKQVAQQEAERSKFLVEKAKQEKLAAVIKAEGEAEAARLIAAATGPSFIQLRQIEAAKEIAEVVSKSGNISFIPQSANMLYQIPRVPGNK